MFIPRTLAELEGGSGKGGRGRALTVIGIVAAALFLILNANITLGQENLEVGQVAPRDIRAPREITFDSRSLTDEARDAAAADVPDLTSRIKVPADNRDDQLARLETVGMRVGVNLDRAANDTITDDELLARIGNEEEISFIDRAA